MELFKKVAGSAASRYSPDEIVLFLSLILRKGPPSQIRQLLGIYKKPSSTPVQKTVSPSKKVTVSKAKEIPKPAVAEQPSLSHTETKIESAASEAVIAEAKTIPEEVKVSTREVKPVPSPPPAKVSPVSEKELIKEEVKPEKKVSVVSTSTATAAVQPKPVVSPVKKVEEPRVAEMIFSKDLLVNYLLSREGKRTVEDGKKLKVRVRKLPSKVIAQGIGWKVLISFEGEKDNEIMIIRHYNCSRWRKRSKKDLLCHHIIAAMLALDIDTQRKIYLLLKNKKYKFDTGMQVMLRL